MALDGTAGVPNWHAYNAMRIGARLELGGRPYGLRASSATRTAPSTPTIEPLDESADRGARGASIAKRSI